MKKLLFILLTILFSCTSPEDEIIKKFSEGKSTKFTKEILHAKIYDTVYTKIALDSLAVFEDRYHSLKNIERDMIIYKDSILKFEQSDSTRHKLLMQEFIKIGKTRRESDRLFVQMSYYYMFREVEDSVAGYFSKIYTTRDTFDIVVLAKDYTILCPTFIFQNTPLPRLHVNFN